MKKIACALLSLVLAFTFTVPVLAGSNAPAANAAALSLTFGQSSLVLARGKSIHMPAVLRSGAKPKAAVRYRSTRPALVRVSQNGRITALQTGRADIIARVAGGRSIRLKVRVVEKPVPLNLAKTSGVPTEIQAGSTARIRTAVYPATATGVRKSYKSSNPRVLSVDAAGLLTAVSPGTARITVSLGGRRIVHTVRVLPADLLIYENTYLQITTKGFVQEKTYGPELQLTIHNYSDDPLSLRAANVLLNGRAVDVISAATAVPGQASGGAFIIPESEMKKRGLEDVADIEKVDFTLTVLHAITGEVILDSLHISLNF